MGPIETCVYKQLSNQYTELDTLDQVAASCQLNFIAVPDSDSNKIPVLHDYFRICARQSVNRERKNKII